MSACMRSGKGSMLSTGAIQKSMQFIYNRLVPTTPMVDIWSGMIGTKLGIL